MISHRNCAATRSVECSVSIPFFMTAGKDLEPISLVSAGCNAGREVNTAVLLQWQRAQCICALVGEAADRLGSLLDIFHITVLFLFKSSSTAAGCILLSNSTGNASAVLWLSEHTKHAIQFDHAPTACSKNSSNPFFSQASTPSPHAQQQCC